MKRKISMLAVVLLVLGISSNAVASSQKEIFIPPKVDISSVVESLDKECYAGAYFKDDGAFKILTTDEERLLRSSKLVRALQRGSDGVQIQLGTVEHSLEELLAAVDKLFDHRDDFCVRGVGPYVQDNTLGVYTWDMSDENKAAIEAFTGIMGIKLFETTPTIRDSQAGESKPTLGTSGTDNEAKETRSVTAKPGKWVYMGGVGNWSTLMVPCVMDYGSSNEQLGVLTAGHGWSTGDTAKIGSTQIGTVEDVWRNSRADVAFIASDSTLQDLHSIYGNYINFRRDPYSGDEVYVEGANGEYTGEILMTGISYEMDAADRFGVHFDSQSYRRCFSYDVQTEAGDSGGAVITPEGSGYAIVGYNIGNENRIDTYGVGLPFSYLEDNYGLLPSQLN